MIKHIPKTLKLPNYEIKINKDVDDDNFYGSYLTRTLELCLSKHVVKHQGFDKYTFCLFSSAAISSAIDLRLTYTNMHAMGGFLFFLYQNNKLKKLFGEVGTNKVTEGSISVPSFALSWGMGETDKVDCSLNCTAAGYLIPTEQKIVISTDSTPEFRPVILMHEIVEWMSFYYGMRIKHSSIQTLGEYLTYIVQNNSFTD